MSAPRLSTRNFFAALAFMLATLPLMVASAALPRVFGQQVTLRTLPLDPWDPMRGQYMDVRLDLGTLDCALIRCTPSVRSYARKDYAPSRKTRLLVVLGSRGGAHTAIALASSEAEVRSLAGDAPYIELREWTTSETGGNVVFTTSLIVPFFFEEGTQARYQAVNADDEAVLRAHVWRGTLRSDALIVRKHAGGFAPR